MARFGSKQIEAASKKLVEQILNEDFVEANNTLAKLVTLEQEARERAIMQAIVSEGANDDFSTMLSKSESNPADPTKTDIANEAEEDEEGGEDEDTPEIGDDEDEGGESPDELETGENLGEEAGEETLTEGIGLLHIVCGIVHLV